MAHRVYYWIFFISGVYVNSWRVIFRWKCKW